jgi:hypothetical protein
VDRCEDAEKMDLDVAGRFAFAAARQLPLQRLELTANLLMIFNAMHMQ